MDGVRHLSLTFTMVCILKRLRLCRIVVVVSATCYDFRKYVELVRGCLLTVNSVLTMGLEVQTMWVRISRQLLEEVHWGVEEFFLYLPERPMVPFSVIIFHSPLAYTICLHVGVSLPLLSVSWWINWPRYISFGTFGTVFILFFSLFRQLTLVIGIFNPSMSSSVSLKPDCRRLVLI